MTEIVASLTKRVNKGSFLRINTAIVIGETLVNSILNNNFEL
jgi:hypothetical protein